MGNPELFDLLDARAPSGWEVAGQRRWVGMVSKWVDRVDSDVHGNAWAVLAGRGKRPCSILLEAHVDEIGWAVRHVDEKGFLWLAPIGGSDAQIAPGRHIVFEGATGPVAGVLGAVPMELLEKKEGEPPCRNGIFADIGARSALAVKKMGLRVGSAGVFSCEASRLSGTRITGRALDNRAGGYVLARTLEILAESQKRPAATVWAANCVQEEIGLCGARMVAHRLRPDLAVVVDVTSATDVPGLDEREHGRILLGGGPVLGHGGANHPVLVERLAALAGHLGIPVQERATPGATRTDADVIVSSRAGIPCALLSIPLRNMHSTVEVVDAGDLESLASLLAGFVLSIRKNPLG